MEETAQERFERKDYELARHLPKDIYHNSYLAGGTYFVECFNVLLEKEVVVDDVDPFSFTVFKKDLSEVLGKQMETKKGRRVILKDEKGNTQLVNMARELIKFMEDSGRMQLKKITFRFILSAGCDNLAADEFIFTGVDNSSYYGLSQEKPKTGSINKQPERDNLNSFIQRPSLSKLYSTMPKPKIESAHACSGRFCKLCLAFHKSQNSN